MARFLGFLVFIYSCALVVDGQNLANLMTIQPGTTNGGWRARTALLNQYATESLQSPTVALRAIDTHGNANTADGKKVRRALKTFFQISESIKNGRSDRNIIASMFKYPLGFKRNPKLSTWNGQPRDYQRLVLGSTNIPPAETFLFCDSSFLVQKAATDQAQDYQGNGITQNGQNLPISAAYAGWPTGRNVPWRAGTHTRLMLLRRYGI